MRVHTPNVSFWYRIRLDPRLNRKFRLIRKHINLWFLYTLLAWLLIASVMLPVHDMVVQSVRKAARAEALAEFESTHAARLRQDQAYLGKACTVWWFGMTHEDRALEIPKKGKRK